MAQVSKINLSEATSSAIVVLDNGDRHAFEVTDLKNGSEELKTDAANGRLALFLSLYESDTDEQIALVEDAATDWTVLFEAA